MNAVNLKDFAKPLPHPARQGLTCIYGAIPPRFRYGRVFWQTYNFLQESQWWSWEELQHYQMQYLGKLLKHAYENVPYYQKVFDERAVR